MASQKWFDKLAILIEVAGLINNKKATNPSGSGSYTDFS
jgi:hypothetical protein